MEFLIKNPAFLFLIVGFISFFQNSKADTVQKQLDISKIWQIDYMVWEMDPTPTKNQHYQNQYTLQIGPETSFWFDPQTWYIDSLLSTKSGTLLRKQALEDALKEFTTSGADAYEIMRQQGLMPGKSYMNEKDFATKVITVWDQNGGDDYTYTVDSTDLTWNIGDSIKTILNYDCIIAKASYHGRNWTVWFTPEIPLEDGPWQFQGLPGLILNATSDDGEFGFEATALTTFMGEIKRPIYNQEKLLKTRRISFLKIKDHARKNRSSLIKAMTGGKVNPKNADYAGSHDLIETDYH